MILRRSPSTALVVSEQRRIAKDNAIDKSHDV